MTSKISLKTLVVTCLIISCTIGMEIPQDIKDDISMYKKDCIEYFKTKVQQGAYPRASGLMKKILTQLPHRDDKSKHSKHMIMRQDKINISDAKENVIAFFSELFKSEGRIGKYLTCLARDAVNKANLIYTNEFSISSYVMPTINDDTAIYPFLRINDDKAVYEYKDLQIPVTDLTVSEEDRIIAWMAKKDHPEYKDYHIYVIDTQYKYGDDSNTVILTYVKYEFIKLRKINNTQPDFEDINNVQAIPNYMKKYSEDELKHEIEQSTKHNLSQILLTIYTNKDDPKEKEEFTTTSVKDQEIINDWQQKIISTLTNPDKVADNYIATVEYCSNKMLEDILTHEIAHIVYFGYLLKTGKRQISTNMELFPLYIEAITGRNKNFRLDGCYCLVFTIVATDFLEKLLKKTNDRFDIDAINDIMSSAKSYKEKVADIQKICDNVGNLLDPTNSHYGATKKFLKTFGTEIGEIPFLDNYFDELRPLEITPHLQALYNALQLKRRNLPIMEAMEVLATEPTKEITPENFCEVLDFLNN